MGAWHKTRIMLLTLVMATTGSVTAGCADESSGAGLVIGVILPLSGDNASHGLAQRNAIQLMTDERRLDETRIRIVYRDDQGQPEKAGAIGKELIEDDDVAAVVGGANAATAAAVARAAETAAKPVILLALDAEPIDPAKTPNLFAISPAGDAVADVLLARLRQVKATRVALLAADDAYGQQGADELVGKSGDFGVTIVDRQTFSATGGDIGRPVQSATDDGADALVVLSPQPNAVSIVQLVRSANFGGRIFFGPGAGAEALLDEATAEGVSLVYPSVIAAGEVPATSLDGLRRKKFITDYSGRYGAFVPSAAASADAVAIFATAAELAGGNKPRQVRDELRDLTYEGLLGTYDFAELRHNGLSRNSLEVVTLRNRTWKLG